MNEKDSWNKNVLLIKELKLEWSKNAFDYFKSTNLTLETVCDKKTMKDWENFISWMIAHLFVEDINFKEELGFEITPLIESAHDICSQIYYKRNGDLIEMAKYYTAEQCDECNGNGFLNEIEDEECDLCEGEGSWIDADIAFDCIREAGDDIIANFNISTFINLTKIKL